MEQREWGYQKPDGKFVRHLQFTNMQELWALVMREYPTGLYCSASRYADPSATPMQNKGWISAELIFDLDGVDGGNMPVEELKLLVEILKLDIGISEENLSIYFSGNKGFHVHVQECEYDNWGGYERHCMAQKIKDKGVSTLDVQVTSDIHRIFRVPGSLNCKSGLPKTRFMIIT